mgnify:CR=1 FL=1
MGVSVKLSSASVSKALRNIDKYKVYAVNQVKEEIAYTALSVESDAKRRCPVKTGRLRASIKTLIASSGLGAIVGTPVEYAADVEFGSSSRKAKPYLFPAAESARAGFIARLKQIFKRNKI